MNDIQSIRNTLKQKRLSLSPEFIAAQALAFAKQLPLVIPAKAGIQRVGVYLAARGELDLSPSIEWLWQQGHQVYVPILTPEQSLIFGDYRRDTKLTANQFGLLEPIDSERIAAQDLDYVLVPLVAFDRQGHRIGMGKGYYDRTFAFRLHTDKPILIGCAYAFQKVDNILAKPHDVKLDQVITPN